MEEIKKLIWATDGSIESGEALKYARFIAETFNSETIGIHVIAIPDKLLSEYFREPESELYKWMDKAQERHRAKLLSIAHEFATQGLYFRGAILNGEPSNQIVEFARSEEVNLIVMGKRGLGFTDRMLTGRTTLRVLRESSVPVLTVSGKDREGTVEIRNILVPLYISHKVDTALNYAIDLAERINANIAVVYVFTSNTSDYEIPSGTLEDLFTLCSNKLAKRIKKIKIKYGILNKEAPKLEINTEVIQGINPSIAIVDYISSKNIDLIVINTCGRKGIKKVLGSVTEKVIQESLCPVLVLNHRDGW